MPSDPKWKPPETFTPEAAEKSDFKAGGTARHTADHSDLKAGGTASDTNEAYEPITEEAAAGSTTETKTASFEHGSSTWAAPTTFAGDEDKKVSWVPPTTMEELEEKKKELERVPDEATHTDTVFVDTEDERYKPVTGTAAKGSTTETTLTDASEDKTGAKKPTTSAASDSKGSFKAGDKNAPSSGADDSTDPTTASSSSDKSAAPETGSLVINEEFIPAETSTSTPPDLKPPEEVVPSYSFSGFSSAPKAAPASRSASTAPTSTSVMKILFPGPIYPEVAYNFVVFIGIQPFGDFKEVSDYGYEIDPYKYKEGGRNRSQRMLAFDEPGKYKTLKMKWGTVRWSTLYDWIDAVQVGGMFRRTVFLVQLGRDGSSITKVMVLSDAWPISWTGAPLDSHGGDWSMEELEIAYEQFAVAMPAAMMSGSASQMAGAAASVAGQAATALLSTATGLHPKASIGKFASAMPELTFDINPDSLSLKRSSDIKEDGYSDSSPAMLFDGGKFDDLEFSVLLDESEYRGAGASALSVLGAVSGLAGLATSLMSAAVIAGTSTKSILTAYDKLVALMKPKLDTTTAMVRPCLVKFMWGDLVFVGAIETADLDVSLWDQNGIPRRGTVKVVIKGRYNWSGTTEADFFPAVDATTT